MSDEYNRVKQRRQRREHIDAKHQKRLRAARAVRYVLMVAIAVLMLVIARRNSGGPVTPELSFLPEELARMAETTLRIPHGASPDAPASVPTPVPTPTPDAEARLRHRALLDAGFVDVRALDGVAIDMRYASENNFMGKSMYPGDGCYLTAGTAAKLSAAQAYAWKHGAAILVFDAYRPHRYQQVLYDLVEDKRFIADPTSFSRHSRGAAIDVALCDEDGLPLDMPTEYDAFTEAATRAFRGATEEQKSNLALLTAAMTQAGFTAIQSEWWHYDDPEWRDYPPLDLELPAWLGEMPQTDAGGDG